MTNTWHCTAVQHFAPLLYSILHAKASNRNCKHQKAHLLLHLSIVNTRRLATRLTCQCLTPKCWLLTSTMYLQKYLARTSTRRIFFILCQCFYYVSLFDPQVLTFDIFEGHVQRKLSLQVQCTMCTCKKSYARNPARSVPFASEQVIFSISSINFSLKFVPFFLFFFSSILHVFLINVKI